MSRQIYETDGINYSGADSGCAYMSNILGRASNCQECNPDQECYLVRWANRNLRQVVINDGNSMDKTISRTV